MPKTLVAYGTSLTAAGAWVDQLSQWLHTLQPGQWNVIKSGMNGLASNTGVKHLAHKVLAHKPDVLFLEFAINDAFRFYKPDEIDFEISFEKSRANLNQIIDSVYQVSPHCRIFLQTMNSCWDAPNGWQSLTARPNLAGYYEGYRNVAAARNLPLIDHHVTWRVLESHHPRLFRHYLDDGVHPTPEACQNIITPAIKARLQSEGLPATP